MISENSTFRSKFPDTWENKLSTAIERNRHLNCATCNGNFVRGANMDEFLKDFEFVQSHFEGGSDIGKRILNWSERRYKEGDDIPISAPQLSEAHQFLNFLRRNDIKEMDIKNIDGAFFDDLEISKKYDIELKNGNTIYFELKNKDFLSKAVLDKHDVEQVLGSTGAFSKIAAIGQYQWTAFLRRFGDGATSASAETHLKSLWKKAFQNTDPTKGPTSTDIFNTNPNLWKQFDRVGGGKIEDVEDFQELINHSTFNINQSIFSFIKAE
jgi:hypothetical protein